MLFRPLNADEIEVRVAQVTDKGCSLLLYKDSRVDMRILDETVGQESWQKRFYEYKGTLFCSVGIRLQMRDGSGCEWVWKDDAGAPSNMEAEKGEASDAFKRACFNWGIGRELYTAPFIWASNSKCVIKQGKNGKPACYDRFKVEKIRIEDGVITGLAIKNETTDHLVFTWVKEGA